MARALAWLQSCVQALRRDGRIWPLFVLAVLPGAILLAVLIAQQGSQIQSTRAELEGIVSFRATTPLLRAVYAHRRQVRAALTQGPQAATETEITRIEAAFERAVRGIEPRIRSDEHRRMLESITADWQSVREQWRTWTPARSEAEHGRIADAASLLRRELSNAAPRDDQAAAIAGRMNLASTDLPVLRRFVVQVRETFDHALQDAAGADWATLRANLDSGLAQVQSRWETLPLSVREASGPAG